MDHFSQVGVLEVFLEATPTTFLFLVLAISGLGRGSENNGLQQLLLGNYLNSGRSIGDKVQFILFCVSCASSIFSSAFGISRYLRITSVTTALAPKEVPL